MRYLTILFDFDGTLADTGELALRTLNTLAPEFGLTPITREEIPALKMLSAWQLLVRRSGIPLWNLIKIWKLERRAREEFARHAEEIRLFAGIPEMVQALRAVGVEIGIVSSNDREIVVDALNRAGIQVDFIHSGSRLFGKARAIKEALREYDVVRSRVVYVGDELRDVEACKKAGIDMIAVGWGFNAPEALRASGARLAATPQELLAILSAQ